MKSIVGLSLAGVLLAVTGRGAHLDQWVETLPPDVFRHLYDVTYAAGLFIAVGETAGGVEPEILTSPDGDDWTRRDARMGSGDLLAVTYGAGVFVAVGASHENAPFLTDGIISSVDGSNWTRRVAGISNRLLDVCHGDGGFVAVGERGAVVTSSDGIAWADHSLQSPDRLWGVTSGEGGVVAVGGGESQEAVILTSRDGVHWTRQTPGTPRLRDVAYGNGQFVVVGEARFGMVGGPLSDTILRSRDGVTWTAASTGIRDHLLSIIFSEKRFIAVGQNGWVTSSEDGVNWVLHRRGTEAFEGIARGKGRYVTVDYNQGAIFRTLPPRMRLTLP